MTKEENIKLIADYIKTGDILEQFCNKVVKEYSKYDYLKDDVYSSVNSYEVDEDGIDINTRHHFMGETDYNYIRVPIKVFYENNIEEYVKNLYEKRVVQEEAEKKADEERAKRRAIEEIQRLKEKYNL